MKILRFTLLSLSVSACAFAQGNELALTVGPILSQDRGTAPATVNIGSGLALQANYAHRIIPGNQFATLYADIVVMANTQRAITSTVGAATRDVASLYVVPGLKIRFVPGAKAVPWFSVGGGYALYEQSKLSLNGVTNTASRHLNRGAIGYGGGLDWKVRGIVSVRAEVRDYYSGSPGYNVTGISGGQHNFVTGGGILLDFK